MPLFRMSKPFPPCIVTKKLVKRIEFDILQYAADLDGEHFSSDNIKIWIRDGTGSERVNSIDEFRNDSFANDTRRIGIEYNSLYRSPVNLKISVEFSVYSYLYNADGGSCVEFSLTCDTAKETAKGRVEQLIEAIKPCENRHFFNQLSLLDPMVRLFSYGLGVIGVGNYIMSVFSTDATVKKISEHASFWLIFICCGYWLYFGIAATFPYCFFDSPSTTRRLDTIKYYTRTFVIGLLGVSAIKVLVSYVPLG